MLLIVFCVNCSNLACDKKNTDSDSENLFDNRKIHASYSCALEDNNLNTEEKHTKRHQPSRPVCPKDIKESRISLKVLQNRLPPKKVCLRKVRYPEKVSKRELSPRFEAAACRL